MRVAVRAIILSNLCFWCSQAYADKCITAIAQYNKVSHQQNMQALKVWQETMGVPFPATLNGKAAYHNPKDCPGLLRYLTWRAALNPQLFPLAQRARRACGARLIPRVSKHRDQTEANETVEELQAGLEQEISDCGSIITRASGPTTTTVTELNQSSSLEKGPSRSASCSDITGTGSAAPATTHCKDANNSLIAARTIRQKHPEIAAEQYKKAAASARNAGDTTLELSILREATSAASSDKLASGQPQAPAAGAADPSHPVPLQDTAKTAALPPDQNVARSSLGGDCSEVKENIDWVFRDSGAQNTYAQQRRAGKSEFDAVVGAQGHNPPVQALLRRCASVAEAYLASREGGNASAEASNNYGLPAEVKQKLDDLKNDPDRLNAYRNSLNAADRAEADKYLANQRVARGPISKETTKRDPKDTNKKIRGSEEGSEWCKTMKSNVAMNNTAYYFYACGSDALSTSDTSSNSDGPSQKTLTQQERTATGPQDVSQQNVNQSVFTKLANIFGGTKPSASDQVTTNPAAKQSALSIEPNNVLAQAQKRCEASKASSAEQKKCTTAQEAALIMDADPGIKSACGGIKDESTRNACAIDAYVMQLIQIAANDNCYYDAKGRQCYPGGAKSPSASSDRNKLRDGLRKLIAANKRTQGMSDDVTEEEVDIAEEELKRSEASKQVAQSTSDWNRDDALQHYLHSGNLHSRGMLDNSGNLIDSTTFYKKGLTPQPSAFGR